MTDDGGSLGTAEVDPADADGQIDLGAIRPPLSPPSPQPDRLALNEELALPPKQRVEYEHIKTVDRYEDQLDRVRQERDGHQKECTRLRAIELDHARLNERYRGDRWRDGGVVLAMGIGGAIISQTAAQPGMWLGCGWALLVLAGTYGMTRSVLGTR